MYVVTWGKVDGEFEIFNLKTYFFKKSRKMRTYCIAQGTLLGALW